MQTPTAPVPPSSPRPGLGAEVRDSALLLGMLLIVLGLATSGSFLLLLVA